MFRPSARVIADSLHPTTGVRLTTMVISFNHVVQAQFLTHRVFSHNSASLRAIPTKRILQRILTLDVEPLHWGVNQRGMQANGEMTGLKLATARSIVHLHKLYSVATTWALGKLGVHKEVANRYINAHNAVEIVVSGTEWQNFFNQRCNPHAQPEMRLLAEAMRDAYNSSTPVTLGLFEYHLPFGDKCPSGFSLQDRIKVSVARCARVSYLTHDGNFSVNADIELYNKLFNASPPHFSPMEHVAQAHDEPNQLGNFGGGWKQWRHHLTKPQTTT